MKKAGAPAGLLDERKQLPRQRLFPPTTVLALAAGATAALALIFPKGRELSEIAAQARTDALSLQYLRNLVRASPGDIELQLVLAEQEMVLGNFSVARSIAESLRERHEAEWQQRIDLLLLKVAQRDRALGRHTASHYRTLEREIQILVIRLIEHGPIDRQLLEALKPELMRPLTGGSLLEKLQQHLARQNQLRADELEEFAALSLSQGSYRAASGFRMQALKRSGSQSERRRLFLAAVRDLQSGGLYDRAGELLAEPPTNLGEQGSYWAELAKVSLAVGKPALAERYMKRALKMAMQQYLQQYRGSLAGLGEPAYPGSFVLVANTSATEPLFPPLNGKPPALPFDEDLYRLGYDVFLANRNVNDAYLLAQAAVRARPEDMAWRRRLAQVARWVSRPDEALEHWLAAAKLGDTTAWAQVEELTPLTQDEDLRVAALQAMIKGGRGTELRLEELINSYDAQGKPESAIAFLDQLYREKREARFLLRLADFQQHIGDRPAEAATLQRLAADQGMTPALALRLAKTQIALRQMEQAFATLRDSDKQGASDAYWQLFAELANLLQKEDDARAAYKRLIAAEKPTQRDLAAYYYLTWRQDPAEAARAAELAWLHYSDAQLFMALLNLEAAALRWQTLAQRLDAMTPAQRQLFSQNAQFYALSAQVRLQNGQPERALLNSKIALSLAPGDNDIRSGLIWLLLDMRQYDELQGYAHAWRNEAMRGGAMAQAVGSAFLQLGQPKIARAIFRAELQRMRRNRTEPSRNWLETYADAQEQSGYPQLARAIHRYLWQQLLQEARKHPNRFVQVPQNLIDAARLALSETSGDRQTPFLQLLLAAPSNQQGDTLARAELLASWLNSRDQPLSARYFLLRRKAQRLATPDYLRLNTALANEDTAELARLLGRGGVPGGEGGAGAAMPIYDRIYGARMLDDHGRELGWAAEGLRYRDRDPILHQLLTEAYFPDAHQVAGGIDASERGVLHTISWIGKTQLALNRHHSLSTLSEDRKQQVQDGTLINVPPHDRSASLGWRYQGEKLDLAIEGGRRYGFDTFYTGKLETGWQVDGHLGLRAGAHYGQATSDAATLIVAGKRDGGSLGLDWKIGRREYLRLDYGDWRYRAQRGEYFGSGKVLEAELGHRLRLDEPDINLRLTASRGRYKADGEVPLRYLYLLPGAMADFSETGDPRPYLASFMPQSSTQYGVAFGYNETGREPYRQAWAPHATLALSHNTVSGSGYDVRIGMGGSLFGALPGGVDRLRLELVQASGTRSQPNEQTRSVVVSWQYWFDKLPR